jgi:hypothetical protein
LPFTTAAIGQMAGELTAPPSNSAVTAVLYASQVIGNILLLATIGFDSKSNYLKLEARKQ